MKKLTVKEKNSLNKQLTNLPVYHKYIPLDVVFEILEKNNIIPLQEDKTPWSGFLCGDGYQQVHFDLAREINGELVEIKNWLNLSWYKMQSGSFEIISYIS